MQNKCFPPKLQHLCLQKNIRIKQIRYLHAVTAVSRDCIVCCDHIRRPQTANYRLSIKMVIASRLIMQSTAIEILALSGDKSCYIFKVGTKLELISAETSSSEANYGKIGYEGFSTVQIKKCHQIISKYTTDIVRGLKYGFIL